MIKELHKINKKVDLFIEEVDMIDSLSDFGQIFPEEYLFKEYQQDISVVKEIMFSNIGIIHYDW